MRGSIGLFVLFIVMVLSAAGEARAQNQNPIRFDIPAQPLGDALRAVGSQINLNVMFDPPLVAGKTAPAISAQMTSRQVLDALLKGTGIKHEFVNETTVVLVAADAPVKTTGTAEVAGLRLAENQADPPPPPVARNADSASQPVSEIVVTGTNIRGVYPSSSPVEVHAYEDIVRMGATTTEQFIQRLPQNSGTRTQFAGFATPDSNREAVNGVDLRGLGAGTTLVLLNGRRLALASQGQAVDISLIPLNAVERVEILTDGASAIYGSDAIGGVVNFVLRKDFEGARTQVNYGGVTSGSLRQKNFTQTFGDRWDSGHALFSYDYFSGSGLKASERDYAAAASPALLSPDDERQSALVTLTQALGSRWDVSGDFAYSQRDFKSYSMVFSATNPLNDTFITQNGGTEQYFANLGANVELGQNLHGRMAATYSEIEVASHQLGVRPATGLVFDDTRRDTNHVAIDVTALLDGTLFATPAGMARFSIGAGYLDESYTSTRTASSFLSDRDLGRSTTYAFGELLLPLVAQNMGLPLVRRLELSLAARYTRYDDTSSPALGRDFGDSSSPKIGLLWSPASALDIRATYGESFRAPSLTQIDPSASFNSLAMGFFTIDGVSGSSVMQVAGPSTQLDPETAQSYTVGFDLRPARLPGFHLSATYFNIDYQDRIGQADVLAGLSNPAAFPDAVYRPSAAQLEAFLRTTVNNFNNSGIDLTNPAAASQALASLTNFWILDIRTRNLAVSQLDGIDVNLGRRFDVSWGQMNVGAQLTRLLDYRQQTSASSPVLSIVDTVLHPVGLRGRGHVGLSRGRLDATLSVNYSDDYSNPFALGGPQAVDSWMTLDCNVAYDFGPSRGGALKDVKLSLSVQNLLDKEPPRVLSSGPSGAALGNPVGFDPANADPLGRVLLLGVAKKW